MSCPVVETNTVTDEHAARVLRHFGPDPANWVRPGATDHDVVVVGGGQSGLGIGFALRRAGIGRVSIPARAEPAMRAGSDEDQRPAFDSE